MYRILSKEMINEAVNSLIDNGTTKEELFIKAGRAIFSNHRFLSKTLVVIGNNDNGLIGIELALKLKEENKDVYVLVVEENNDKILSKITDLILARIPIYNYSEDFKFTGYDTFVDAIYGIDFDFNYSDNAKKVIHKLNSLDTFTISIDINSGLDANNGITDLAVISDTTIAIGYIKPGNLLNNAKDYMGELNVTNIGIPYNKETYYMYSADDLDNVFVKRKNNSNKGDYGYVGVMGGSIKYSGALKLSNLSLIELSVGAGVSRIIAPYEICDSLLPYLVESTLYPVTSEKGVFKFNVSEIEDSIKGLKALAFGMGVTVNDDTINILKYLINNFTGRLLIDADGLNALAKIGVDYLDYSVGDIVITPHVLEFSRLINVDKEFILKDPIKYAKEFTLKHKCVLVLKGSTTIVAKDGKIYLVPSGCVSLSKGGSGDLLSGIITGIMGYTDTFDSALAGSYTLGAAGEIAFKKYGAYSVLGRDIINILKEIMKAY